MLGNLGLFWKVELEYKNFELDFVVVVDELYLYSDSCLPGVGECNSVVYLQSVVTFGQGGRFAVFTSGV